MHCEPIKAAIPRKTVGLEEGDSAAPCTQGNRVELTKAGVLASAVVHEDWQTQAGFLDAMRSIGVFE